MSHFVVIDDDVEMLSMVKDHLTSEGHAVRAFSGPTEALQNILAENERPTVVLTDLQMPEMSGVDLVKRIKLKFPDTPIIIMTAFGSIQSAVEAIRKGAYDYITKPFKLSDLSHTIQRATQISQLAAENVQLRAELKKSFSKGNLIGKSQSMRDLFSIIDRVAPAQSNILVTGESGTGKEVVARVIHNLSPRTKEPFIAINCSAIPDNLLESELFGYIRGAFTGADRNKTGLFEEANKGTLFLDEIGDMAMPLQAKLLRVLQEKKIRPVGGTKDIDIDIRVIAATHKDLKNAIREGLFREDLFYRLNVIPVQLPALRHRRDDIPLLAQSFLERYSALNRSKAFKFSPEALEILIHREWPGNVRELENLIERLVVLTDKAEISAQDIPPGEDANGEDFYGQAISSLPTIEALEKKYVQFVMQKCGWKKEKAAQILGVNRRTLYRKEIEYGFADPNASKDETDDHDDGH